MTSDPFVNTDRLPRLSLIARRASGPSRSETGLSVRGETSSSVRNEVPVCDGGAFFATASWSCCRFPDCWVRRHAMSLPSWYHRTVVARPRPLSTRHCRRYASPTFAFLRQSGWFRNLSSGSSLIFTFFAAAPCPPAKQHKRNADKI